MSEHRLRQLAMAGRAVTLRGCLFVDRKSRRVDTQFHELARSDMSLDDIGWDVEVFGILGVHGDSIHQLIAIGELLGVEQLLKP